MRPPLRYHARELGLDTLERMRAETALPYDSGPIFRSGDIVLGPELLALSRPFSFFEAPAI